MSNKNIPIRDWSNDPDGVKEKLDEWKRANNSLTIEITSTDGEEVIIDLLKVKDIIKAQSDKQPFNGTMNNCGIGEDRACIIKLTDGKEIYVMGDSSEVWFKIRTAIEEQTKRI